MFFVEHLRCSGCKGHGCETTLPHFRFRLSHSQQCGCSALVESLPTGNLPGVAKATSGIFPPEPRPVLALPTTFCKGRALGYKDMPWAKARGEAPCRPVKKPWLGRNKKSPTTHSHQLKAGISCDCSGVPWWAGMLTSAVFVLIPSTTRGLFWLGLMAKTSSDPCRCGCGLTVAVCEALFRLGVPSQGLTTGQAGLLISKAEANDWVLPEAFAFARNKGEWIERRWQGKK